MSAELDLSDNANLWGAPPAAARALREVPARLLASYPEPFAPTLKAAIAARLDVDPACVALGCGSDELLEASFRVLVGAGRALAYPTPTFSMVEPFAQGAGVRCVPVPLRPDASPDVPALLNAKADALYLCSPNNPTGGAIARGDVQALLGGTPGLVLLDEAYVEFSSQPSRAQLAAASERLLVFRTFSKAWGLAGLRVGYVVGAPALIAALQAQRGPYTVNAVAAHVLEASLSEDEGWVRERANEAREAAARLIVELARRGLSPLPTEANFVFVPTRRAKQLAEALLRRGVRVRAFNGLPGVGDALRIAVGPEPAVRAALAALDEVLA